MGDRLGMAAGLLLRVGDVVDLLEGKHAKAWVVNQWRKRSSDPFPAPVVGGRSPRFDAVEVLPWLWDRDLLTRDRPGPAWFWRQAVRTLPAAIEHDERAHLRNYLAAMVMVAVQVRDAGGALGSTSADLADVARALESQHPELRGLLIDALAQITPGADVVALLCRTLSAALVASTAEDPSSTAPGLLDDALVALAELWPETAVSHLMLVDLVATITASWPASTALDPACGEALVLTELAQSRRPRFRAVAVERDHGAAATARIRFALRGLPVDVRTGDAFDVLASEGETFDLVVLDPPAGRGIPGLSQWLALVDRVLERTGRAAVAVPASALRANAAAAELLHRRQVSAVMLLPSLVRSGVRDAQALVVMEAAGACEQVLVVDLRSVKPRDGDPHTEQVAALVNRWLDDQPAARPAIDAFVEQTTIPVRVLPADVVVADGVVPPPVEASADVHVAIAGLQAALAADPALVGADKLQRALGIFARKHSIGPDDA